MAMCSATTAMQRQWERWQGAEKWWLDSWMSWCPEISTLIEVNNKKEHVYIYMFAILPYIYTHIYIYISLTTTIGIRARYIHIYTVYIYIYMYIHTLYIYSTSYIYIIYTLYIHYIHTHIYIYIMCKLYIYMSISIFGLGVLWSEHCAESLGSHRFPRPDMLYINMIVSSSVSGSTPWTAPVHQSTSSHCHFWTPDGRPQLTSGRQGSGRQVGPMERGELLREGGAVPFGIIKQ